MVRVRNLIESTAWRCLPPCSFFPCVKGNKGEVVKPILAAIGAAKENHVMTFPRSNYPVKKVAAVITKRKAPANKGKRLIFENMIKAGPFLALPFISQVKIAAEMSDRVKVSSRYID